MIRVPYERSYRKLGKPRTIHAEATGGRTGSSDREGGKNKEISQRCEYDDNHEIVYIPHVVLRPSNIFTAVLAPFCTLRYLSFTLRA
jgi:hypothetical protein